MKRGFILIEFLTAIGIIAILAAILFPVFARAREKAHQTDCLNNLLNIGISLHQYAADYYGHYPPADNDLAPLLSIYLPEERSILCPSLEDHYDSKSGDYSYHGGYATDDRGDLLLAVDRTFDIHNSGGNALFIDGHAKWLNTRDTQKDADFRTMPGIDVEKFDAQIKENEERSFRDGAPPPPMPPPAPAAPKEGPTP